MGTGTERRGWWVSVAVPVLFVACLAVGVGLLRRKPRDGVVLVAMGAGGLCLLLGLTDQDHFGSSQLPTDLPVGLDRTALAVVIGGGTGLVLGPIIRWARDRTPSQDVSSSPASP